MDQADLVKTRVWIAINTHVLVAILKRELKADRSLSAILQILSLTLFEKNPVIQAKLVPFHRLILGVATLARAWGPSSVSPTFWRTWLRQQPPFLAVTKH